MTKLNDLSKSGPPCESSGDFLPDTLEARLAASVYLAEIGIRGSVEDIAYQTTVQLAEARQANKDLHDMMSNEIARLRARWDFDRTLANDTLEEVVDLEEQIATLEAECDFNVDALITAQERLDNALLWCDDLSAQVPWANLLEEN